MTIRISNASAEALVRSYAHTKEGLLVWLELAPLHPKIIGAIWADLVKNHRSYLQLEDEEKGVGKVVYGLGHAYIRLEMDALALAVGHNARAKLTRLIAPEAIRPDSLDAPFYVFGWPGLASETVLAATLEKVAPYPVQIGWGAYLLAKAVERGHAIPLVTGGAAFPGYEIEAAVNWPDIISQGLLSSRITLNGKPTEN